MIKLILMKWLNKYINCSNIYYASVISVIALYVGIKNI